MSKKKICAGWTKDLIGTHHGWIMVDALRGSTLRSGTAEGPCPPQI